MLMALTVKNKVGFVNGSIPYLDADNLLYGSQVCYNSMVISWILNFVINEIVDSLLCKDTAIEIQEDLQDHFYQSNGPWIYQIMKHLVALTQCAIDVNTYFTRLMILWDEHKDFQPVPAC